MKDATGRPLEIVHRDVSPHNILVSTKGTAKLIDFGIAKARSRAGAETSSGVLKGKIQYMAPEQALGQRLDRRADIWAVGAVLYTLLDGQAAVRGREPARHAAPPRLGAAADAAPVVGSPGDLGHRPARALVRGRPPVSDGGRPARRDRARDGRRAVHDDHRPRSPRSPPRTSPTASRSAAPRSTRRSRPPPQRERLHPPEERRSVEHAARVPDGQPALAAAELRHAPEPVACERQDPGRGARGQAAHARDARAAHAARCPSRRPRTRPRTRRSVRRRSTRRRSPGSRARASSPLVGALVLAAGAAAACRSTRSVRAVTSPAASSPPRRRHDARACRSQRHALTDARPSDARRPTAPAARWPLPTIAASSLPRARAAASRPASAARPPVDDGTGPQPDAESRRPRTTRPPPTPRPRRPPSPPAAALPPPPHLRHRPPRRPLGPVDDGF